MAEAKTEKKVPLIKGQLPMQRVLYALAPAVVASVYFFGWRSLAVLAVVNIAGFFTEYCFCRYYKEPVSSAVFVSNVLFALILPPTLPLYMAVIGIVFGILFGKMVFGGFGKNVFNPALVGRAFIYVNFSVNMNNKWFEPFRGFPAGLTKYSETVDAITKATPIRIMADGGDFPIADLFWGNISGCYGETCAILLILGGLYIIWKKAANYRIVVSCFISAMLLQGIFWQTGIEGAVDPIRSILSGGFMIGAFFMATDPVSATQTQEGRWIYGTLIGLLTIVIRQFSNWPEGIMYAILLANMFAPITDIAVKGWKEKQKAKQSAKNE
jgi:Na+-transporting NADH:ubiquinone oxidoreductase subunit B